MRTGLLALLTVVPLLAQGDNDKRIQESAKVLDEIMAAPDNSIPQGLLQKAHCVGIVPNLKRAGFIVGAKYGKGMLVCRRNGSWSAPETIRIEGGSVGLQIGAGETDVVFLVMNAAGESNLLKDKFTLGAEGAVMAGPVGRSADAQTDAAMRAEVLGYSRSRGVFAGVALNGATLRPDSGDNRALYGRDVTPQEILHGDVKAPASAQPLYDALNRYSGNRTGD
ncbi:MAG: lipid-binding SYLF domain-containing protein [Acidobacteriia bacterium]|nr:lipid-binding SYLF domain-containing protein [Terriglobia bacterium]